ncbi:ATP-binding protein [Streptomyces ficellus]|uniref:histidine kinase n=1 Tax=Streptomyces ficellus TaxID=1977088 RepID=A0ABT7Z5G6_9ACTN|nr:ATP-binding protein [Streptomyces ficellus]MDN3294748.1 ATP-binding protein [Streptomyces ficellus]
MVREGSSPGSPGPASPALWALPAIVIAAGTVAAVVLAPAAARMPVAWLGAVAFVAVALSCGAAARRGREVARLRATVAEQRTALERQEAETVRLAETLLPDVVARLRKGEFPEDVLASLDAADAYGPGLTPQFRAAHRAVLRSVVEAVTAEEDLRDSAQRAFVNIARRVQAIVHQQAQELREMEDRHGRSPSVFGDLLRLDHGTALIGRLADSIAVLGGARPGRQWSRAVPLYSVLRGAMSRIIDYQRVELHSVSEVAVIGPAVEPLIHALAELLDNATRYSPPQTKVHLTAVDVTAGIAVEIEDGGVSMSEEARGRAERMLRQAQEGIDLNDLGETPRLGLAVVGRLSQAYNFRVSLRSSAYGGVRAVLVVPQDLITTVSSATGVAHGIGTASGPRGALSPAARRAAREPSRPASGPRAPEPDPDAPVVTERTANGLPQRRRKNRVTAPPTAPAAPAPAAAAPATASGGAPTTRTATEPEPAPQVQPGMWLAAFQGGLSGDSKPGAEQAGAEQTGADRPGAEQAGADPTGAGWTGSDQTSADQTGAGQTGADQTSDASPAEASKGEQA